MELLFRPAPTRLSCQKPRPSQLQKVQPNETSRFLSAFCFSPMFTKSLCPMASCELSGILCRSPIECGPHVEPPGIKNVHLQSPGRRDSTPHGSPSQVFSFCYL